MKHALFLILPLALAAAPAKADPWVPVDASSQYIVFLDQASVKDAGGYKEADLLFMSSESGTGPLAFLVHNRFQCSPYSTQQLSYSPVDVTGQRGDSVSVNADWEPPDPGSIGEAMVITVCTGVSPNTSAQDMSDPTLTDAMARGRDFLARQAAPASSQ